MRVLVSDTSILIDLERADLLRAAFSVDAEFVVPDLLYERELRGSGEGDLLALGLRVESLDESEVESAQAYRRGHPRLALPDTFALTLAKNRRWLLLTGDGPLRALAVAEQVECHGVLPAAVGGLRATGNVGNGAMTRSMLAGAIEFFYSPASCGRT